MPKFCLSGWVLLCAIENDYHNAFSHVIFCHRFLIYASDGIGMLSIY